MARRRQLALLENASASGSSVDWPGGTGVMYAEGTFSGATVKLQTQSPNGTWMDVGSATTFTANGVGAFILPAGPIKAVISGGPPSAVYAYVVGVPSNI